MTGRRTTRIAALGAGALLALGFFSAAPAGASDGAQADATVQAGTTDVITQTLDLMNKACVDAANLGETATSALASGSGVSVASESAGTGLNLAVSLPALTDTLPGLDSLPLLGSVTGQLAAEPVEIGCATSADGAGLGLSAAGVDALVEAIAPGVDVSALGLDAGALVPSADVSASAAAADAPATSVSATAAAPAPARPRTTTSSSAVRASAAADPATAATTATVSPASSSSTPAGTLARTGAGLGALGLLGAGLVGSGRLLGLGRKLLRIG